MGYFLIFLAQYPYWFINQPYIHTYRLTNEDRIRSFFDFDKHAIKYIQRNLRSRHIFGYVCI
jgi:hypothetical protein